MGEAPSFGAGLPGGLAARPDLAVRYEAMVAELWRAVDPCLLELVRVAVAGALGDDEGRAVRTPVAVAAGFDEAKAAALDSWRTAGDRFTPTERALLAVAEQFVLDAHGVDDAAMAAVVAAIGPAPTVAFVTGLGLFDGQSRLRRGAVVGRAS